MKLETALPLTGDWEYYVRYKRGAGFERGFRR